MNERIRELSKEAFEYALSQRPGSDEFQPIWTEKFAELIVQECANIAHNKQYKHSPAHTVGDCATAIKEHFGVE